MVELLPFIVLLGVADLVLVAVFAVLHRREHRGHLRAWAAAHAIDAVRQAFSAASILAAGSASLGVAARVIQALGAICLLHGVHLFVGRRTHPVWFAASAAAFAWIVAAEPLGLPFFLASLPPSALLGFARIAAGVALLRADGDRVARGIAGVALALWGLHSLNFPFLRSVTWFAPWGYGVATTLAICAGIGILLLDLERARAEERASAARYQELFDGAIEGFFRTSPRGAFVAANPALVRLLGYEREAEVLALDLLRDVYADPADRARILAHSDGDIDTVKVRRRDGSIIEVAVHGRRVRDAAGNVRWFEGSMRDVTEEQRLRDELVQAQRLEALGRLAGGIAHDFNNVLGAIVAATDLARRRIARGQDPERELVDARDAAMRAADLTRQLLALARKTSPNRKALDLRSSVEASARVLGRVIGERVSLEVDLPERELVVLADAGQIDQMLMNLALNARDAMPEGGTLRIALARAGTDERPEARLSVVDTGVGMDDATRRRMFDPFFSTKPAGANFGLGLAMVYAAVTQSDGRIEVESAPGRGTRIDVLLPLHRDAEATTDAREPTGARGSRRARVLLVEDEPGLRRSVEAALAHAGHEVLAAAHGADALDRLRDFRPDLLVTDVVMPGLSGPDLVRAVRAKEPRCAVIFVTGYAPEPLDRALPPSSELLAKPFTIDALLAAVARRLEARDAAAARDEAVGRGA